MPKKDMDYSSCLIYKLVCNNLNVKDCYVGHTTNFKQRKSLHKQNCNNPNSKKYNFKVYQIIRDNGGWNNWSMILVENYPCDDVLQARARERYWYELFNCKLNSDVPNRSKKEYQKIYNENNKEKIAEKCKEYYENNKEIIKQIITCECGKQFQNCKKARHLKTKVHLNYIQSIS
jgi:hypothetical protein